MLLIEDKRERYVVDKKNFKGSVQSILYGQKCPYSGKTEQKYLSQGYVIYDSWDLFWEEMIEPYLLSMQGEWKVQKKADLSGVWKSKERKTEN